MPEKRKNTSVGSEKRRQKAHRTSLNDQIPKHGTKMRILKENLAIKKSNRQSNANKTFATKDTFTFNPPTYDFSDNTWLYNSWLYGGRLMKVSTQVWHLLGIHKIEGCLLQKHDGRFSPPLSISNLSRGWLASCSLRKYFSRPILEPLSQPGTLCKLMIKFWTVVFSLSKSIKGEERFFTNIQLARQKQYKLWTPVNIKEL